MLACLFLCLFSDTSTYTKRETWTIDNPPYIKGKGESNYSETRSSSGSAAGIAVVCVGVAAVALLVYGLAKKSRA